MSEPIYEALLARRRGTASTKTQELSLAQELDACAFFADGTRRGELVPLADFTRHRMAAALRAASAALSVLPDGAGLLAPGVARIAAERANGRIRAEHPNASRHALMAAAECYLAVAQHGADGWHHADGRYAPPGGWPFSESHWFPSADREENLVTAGAYILAALDAPAGEITRTTT